MARRPHGKRQCPMKSVYIWLFALQLLFSRFVSFRAIASFFRATEHYYPLRSLPTHIISLPYCISHFQYIKQTTLVVVMAINTRSGAPTTAPTVASRATKSTQAKKASKVKSKRPSRTKSNKANTTNRVQKRAPVTRKARGYITVNEDSHTIDNDTSRTASPDYISDTPLPRRRREIPETPPPSNQAYLAAENTRLRKELRHRYRSRKDDSGDESSDSEAGEGPRVSFLHHDAGKRPFLSLHEHYPAVNIKYFKQIYWGTFHPSKSMKLAHDALTWSSTPKAKKDNEPESMVQLLRCFEVYGHAICFFASRPEVALELHEALVRYRVRLMEFSLYFSFDSIRTYHYSFMAKRILSRQDDPVAWLAEDYRCQHYLIPKPHKQLQANLPGKSSAPGGVLSCNKFNAGECSRTNCKYPHICSLCQHNHPAKECRSRPVASNSNSVPLGNRITAP